MVTKAKKKTAATKPQKITVILRITDASEIKLLQELQKFFGEKTASKAIVRAFTNYKNVADDFIKLEDNIREAKQKYHELNENISDVKRAFKFLTEK